MKRLLLALLVALAVPAQAQTLRIGMKAAVDGSDPHQSYSPNRNVQMHVYESLVNQDQYLQPVPGLAESWRVIDDTTWEFRLREGVVFHDGTPLTAADIAFSLRRAADARGLRTYSAQLRSFASVEEVDARTVRIRTRGPAPLLHVNLTTIMIVSAAAVGANATEEDFNGGRAAVGTGPYRWVRFTPGSDVTLERAPRHWAPPEPWQRVVFRFIPTTARASRRCWPAMWTWWMPCLRRCTGACATTRARGCTRRHRPSTCTCTSTAGGTDRPS